jgi:uncharacterized membrane protein
MLLFLPPIVQALIGIALIAAGVAAHIVILDVLGCVGIAVGGYRWLRKRNGAGIAQ